jgi:hypothetical protein
VLPSLQAVRKARLISTLIPNKNLRIIKTPSELNKINGEPTRDRPAEELPQNGADS